MSLLLRGLSKEFMKEIGARSREMYELLTPAVDIYEDGSDLVVVLDMPGFEKDRIRTRLQEGYLTVSAKRDPIDADGVVYWQQRPLNVSKRIPLPVKVHTDEDAETVTAKYDNGVLTVRLPIKGVGRIKIQ